MVTVIYNAWKTRQLGANAIDFVTDDVKVALTTSSYTVDIDTHDFFNDITNEVSGTGYTAGGQSLATKSVTQDNTNDRGVFDAADVTWASSTITARYGILYYNTGTASTSPLICQYDFGSDQSSSNGNFTIQWNASGVFAIG